jgi:hypothetical protein
VKPTRRALWIADVAYGRPGYRFDGTNDHYLTEKLFDAVPLHIFAAFKTPASLSGSRAIIGNRGSSGDPNGVSIGMNGATLVGSAGNGTNNANTNGSTLAPSTVYVASLKAADLNGFTGYLNGLQNFSRATAWTVNDAPFRIGALATESDAFNGEVLEALWFSAALGDSDRLRVERYLGRTWGANVA